MKAIIVSRHGTPDVLQLRDIPMSEPLPNEVLIHNHFVGVFPLEQAIQTHQLLESRATSGKLLLKVS